MNWGNWEIVWNNMDYFLWGAFPKGELGGISASILLAMMGIFGAFWIGLAAGLMRLSKRWWVKYPAVVYIEIIRGVPLLMLIFWFYFLAPIMLGHTLPEFQSALVAFIVFTGAYIAEIVRAGVIALPRGQMEAARGTGLSNAQAMTYVILPQALRNMIPSFVNQFVSLTKDTSLAYIIGVNELTRAATQVNNRTLTAPTEIFITIAIMYFIICYVLTAASRRLEAQLSRYQARDRQGRPVSTGRLVRHVASVGHEKSGRGVFLIRKRLIFLGSSRNSGKPPNSDPFPRLFAQGPKVGTDIL